MSDKTAQTLVWIALIGAMLLGALVVVCGFFWLPAYEAGSVDVILSADEVRDPKLVDVVQRTHRHNARYRAAELVAPYQALGILIVGVAAAGMVGLRRWHPPEAD